MKYLPVLLILSTVKCQTNYDYPEAATRPNIDGNFKESESNQARGNSLSFDEYNWPKIKSGDENFKQSVVRSSSISAEEEERKARSSEWITNQVSQWESRPEIISQENNHLDLTLNQNDGIPVVTAINTEFVHPPNLKWNQNTNPDMPRIILESNNEKSTQNITASSSNGINGVQMVDNDGKNQNELKIETPENVNNQESPQVLPQQDNNENKRLSQWNQNDDIPVISTINSQWQNPPMLVIPSDSNELGQNPFGGWFYNEGGKYFQTTPIESTYSDPGNASFLSLNVNNNNNPPSTAFGNSASPPIVNTNNNNINLGISNSIDVSSNSGINNNNNNIGWNPNNNNLNNNQQNINSQQWSPAINPPQTVNKSPVVNNPSNVDSNGWNPITGPPSTNNNIWNPSSANQNIWNGNNNNNQQTGNSISWNPSPITVNNDAVGNSLKVNSNPWINGNNNGLILNNNNNNLNNQQSLQNINSQPWNFNMNPSTVNNFVSNPNLKNPTSNNNLNNNSPINVNSNNPILNSNTNSWTPNINPWNSNRNIVKPPPVVGPTSQIPWHIEPTNSPQALTQNNQIYKHVYVHSAPDELVSDPLPAKPITPPPPKQKHYKVIFIKAPSAPPVPAPVVPKPPEVDEKTLVYVLTKQHEQPELVIPSTEAPKAPSKPEVYFIGYKTNQEKNRLNSINSEQNLVNSYGAPVTNSLGWN